MSKTVISFDIGIKHLSYVLFSYEPTTEEIQIIQWDILNLIPPRQSDEIPPPKTTCSKCCKKSLYVSPKEDQTFCEKHAKLSPFFLPVVKLQSKTIEELQQVVSEKQQTGLEMNIRSKTAVIQHIKNNLLKKRKPLPKTGDISLIEIGRRLNTLLSERVPLEDIKYCLIENQIGNLANRMKTIQGMITTFFLLKTPDAHIEYISSHNKGNLRLPPTTSLLRQTIQDVYVTSSKNKENVVPQTEPVKKTSNYSENKKNSVELVRRICPQSHLEFFLSHKKKDDLSDCFLQGVWFVKVKNK